MPRLPTSIRLQRETRAQANKKRVKALRLHTGEELSIPGGTWASNAPMWPSTTPLDLMGDMGKTAALVRLAVGKRELEELIAKGVDPQRPIGVQWREGHGFGGSLQLAPFLLSCAVPGSTVFVQTGDWGPSPQLHTEVAAAEPVVVAGVYPYSDASPGHWLSRPVFDVWPAEGGRGEGSCPKWRKGNDLRWGPVRAARRRAKVDVLFGFPSPESPGVKLDMPGDFMCVPVPYSAMRALGAPVRVDLLDTPGMVRVHSSAGAVLSSVWRLGDVAFSYHEFVNGLGETVGTALGKHTMPCPKFGKAARVPKNLDSCYKQGWGVYMPGYEEDSDLYGPGVLLMPGASGLNWEWPSDEYEDVELDDPTYWTIAPVVW